MERMRLIEGVNGTLSKSMKPFDFIALGHFGKS